MRSYLHAGCIHWWHATVGIKEQQNQTLLCVNRTGILTDAVGMHAGLNSGGHAIGVRLNVRSQHDNNGTVRPGMSHVVMPLSRFHIMLFNSIQGTSLAQQPAGPMCRNAYCLLVVCGAFLCFVPPVIVWRQLADIRGFDSPAGCVSSLLRPRGAPNTPTSERKCVQAQGFPGLSKRE